MEADLLREELLLVSMEKAIGDSEPEKNIKGRGDGQIASFTLNFTAKFKRPSILLLRLSVCLQCNLTLIVNSNNVCNKLSRFRLFVLVCTILSLALIDLLFSLEALFSSRALPFIL